MSFLKFVFLLWIYHNFSASQLQDFIVVENTIRSPLTASPAIQLVIVPGVQVYPSVSWDSVLHLSPMDT